MNEVARIALPGHEPEGGFDHAAVDPVSDRLYVAHTSNDTVEVVDLRARRHVRSLPGLRGVAGVWVDPESRLLFTSNRDEDTASIFRIEATEEVETHRVRTGARPNGMAFDPGRRTLLVAGVGNPGPPAARPTLTFVDVDRGTVRSTIDAPGRTRWATFHRPTDSFYVNIADPASIAMVEAGSRLTAARALAVPATGPHGLEQDPAGRVLYCACDDGSLVSVDLPTGRSERVGRLSGPPDVLWVNARTKRLYAAVGDPGAVDAFEIDPFRSAAPQATGRGAHTLTIDPTRNEVHVFLPETCEDLVLSDP